MFNQINITIFNVINQFAGKNILLDNIIIFFAEYLPYIFIIILLYFWFQDKERKNIVLYATYSAIVGIVIDFIITLFYFHPRPFMDGVGTNLVSHLAESSFPSDHTTFMFSIAWLIFYFKELRRFAIGLLLFALIGGLSRIYTGVHYPFDILGSFFVALISSFFIFTIRLRLKDINNYFINIYLKIVEKVMT